MNDLFDLDPEGSRVIRQQAAENPIYPDEVKPGMFQGTGKAVALFAPRALAGFAQTLTLAAASPFALIDELTGSQSADPIFRWMDRYPGQWVKDLTPDPRTTGTAANVLGGFLEGATQIAAGGGTPAVMMAQQTIGTAKELVDQGVPVSTALGVGALQGSAAGLGFKLPILGKTLASRIATGAASNLALGVAARGASGAILNAAGQPEAAQQFQALDPTSMLVDTALGTGFGAFHHLMTPTQRDAALTISNAKHYQNDTAPGEPADINASITHQDALQSAIESELRGEPVDVSATNVQHADFVPRDDPGNEVPEEYKALDVPEKQSTENEPTEDAVNFGLPEAPRTLANDHPLLVSHDQDVSPERTALQDQIISKAVDSAPTVEGRKPIASIMGGGGASGKGTILKRLKAVNLVPEHGAVEIDPDKIKEQLPEYKQILKAGDSRAAAVTHEESSALAKKILAAAIKKKADVVLDRTMSDPKKATAEIKALKDAGYDVRLYGVTVEPRTAITRAVKRAEGSGRYVPLDALLKAHKGFAGTFEKLAGMADHASLYDNDVIPGKPPRLLAVKSADALSVMDRKRYNDFVERRNLNEKATTHRELAQAVGTDFTGRGESASASLDTGGNARGNESSGQPLSAVASPSNVPGERLDPILSAANKITADSDVQIPTGETDSDGNVKTVSARELMRQADADIANAKKESAAFEAAATCFLSLGVA